MSIDKRVFTSTLGKTANYNTVDVSIANIIRKINQDSLVIEPFSSHAFRDTFATRAMESGMNPNTLKEILGHSSIKITLDLYAHVMPNTKAVEMANVKIAG
ncbi:MAG: tyrosine-type recombinase/integrase [Parasporobacterium sp.]|nr:tyrosine-type recombinase/integrase [Parasporobacterium sp.]